jgi:peroxin-6
LGASVNLEEIAEACSTTLTGADFYALCADAYALSMKEYITKMTSLSPSSSSSTATSPLSPTSPPPSSTPSTGKDDILVVEQRHFKTAQERLKPSVSTTELNYYRKLQEQFRNKKGNA